MLNPRSHFQEQIIQWMESLGLRCESAGSEWEGFDLVRVYVKEQLKLELILVGITAGVSHFLSAELEQCHAYLTDARRQHLSIILWEDYWISKKEIVKSRLATLLGSSQKIPARLTKARRIDKKTAADFLETNHLNGWVNAKFRYGLFLPNRYYRVLNADFQFDPHAEELLVAVTTFSHPRVFSQNEEPFKSYELVRFASLLNSNVIGGLDKLLHAFVEDRRPDDIMTYADVEWSDGRSYQKLGFERKTQTPPIPFYLDLGNMSRKSKQLSLDRSPETLIIYNAGSIKFVKTFTKPQST